MRQKFERSSIGATALLTAFLTVLIGTEAKAGDIVAPHDLDNGIHRQNCGADGETCAHISGYIKAGSESFARDPDSQRSRLITPPSLLAGIGAAGQATADALNRGISFFEVRHDDSTR
jgi:hypothetical protein